jgi:integrase/recombinase XerD
VTAETDPDEVAAPQSIAEFILMSEAGSTSRKEYRAVLERMERRLGKPLLEARKKDLLTLKKYLRDHNYTAQYGRVAAMFYRACDRKDLAQFINMKSRQKRISPDEILTLPQINEMIRHAPSHRDIALIVVLWNCGQRISATCAVQIKDVEKLTRKDGRIHLRIFFEKVKVDGQQHYGYVTEGVEHVLAWLRVHPDKRQEAPFFVGAHGGGLTRSGGENVVQRVAGRAGLKLRVYPHLFRHSRTTHLLRLGMPESQVRKLLGWAANSNIIARYSHLVDRDAYVALLKAQGLEPPEQEEVAELIAPEGLLQPLVPLVPAPGKTPELKAAEVVGDVEELKAQVNLLISVMANLTKIPSVQEALNRALSNPQAAETLASRILQGASFSAPGPKRAGETDF